MEFAHVSGSSSEEENTTFERSCELVDRARFVSRELVRSFWHLPGGEARHEPVGVRSHQVGDLRLLAQPGEVLGPFEPPETRPALPGRVAVERGDEVDEEFSHDAQRPFTATAPLR